MADIHKRAKRGIRLLLVRQAFLQIFTFAGGIVLARTLDPADFGIFGVTTFIVNALALLGDFGLAPALIQRKEEITDRDLRVGFTMKQVLVTLVVVGLWAAAPWVVKLYTEAPWANPKKAAADAEALVVLVRVLAFNLYLNTWRSMSVLQLERQLNFDRLAWVEVAESILYQTVAVVMALMGYGYWSLIVAVLTRGTFGTVVMYTIAPFPLRFKYDHELALSILRFGIPFQAHRVLGQLRTWVTPTLVASLIGFDAVGFLTWASGNGRKPLVIVQNIVRVSLPHFSRIQDNLEEIRHILARYITYFTLLCGFWLAVIMVAGRDIVEVVYTAKWLPAVPALILYAFLLVLNAMSWITKTALSGTGRVNYVMRVTLFTTIISVSLSIFLVIKVGFIGVPIAEVVSMLLTYPWLLRGLGRRSWRTVLLPSSWVLLPLTVSSLAGYGITLLDVPLAVSGFGAAMVIASVFALTAWLVGPKWLQALVRQKLNQLTKKLAKARSSA